MLLRSTSTESSRLEAGYRVIRDMVVVSESSILYFNQMHEDASDIN